MINTSHNVDKRVKHRNIATKESSNDCGDDHLVDHKSPPLPVGPDLPCVLDVYCELHKAIPMPNVIDGTGRLIRRKIKARFRKVNLFFKANLYLGI
jgi:hypothetical protein